MPKYRKKITRPMEYAEFRTRVQAHLEKDPYYPAERTAFLSVLFFTGCRISEAIALTDSDINCTPDMIYIQFFRLKGSKQTDPNQVPNADYLKWLCGQKGKLFDFSRTTGYRIVTEVFPELYPHYFRMNYVTKVTEEFGDTTVYRTLGICAQSIDSYRGKVDLKRVAESFKKDLE